MFTQGEIEQVIAAARLGNGPGIDFDFFGEVVEAASECGVLGHDVEVLDVEYKGSTGNLLILIVNGIRFASRRLSYEELWHEDWSQITLQDQVLKLLETAVREIKQIETVRDTWYAASPVGP